MTVCVFTLDETEAPLFRIPVAPSEGNGIRAASRPMVDKLTTVSRDRMGERIGRLVGAVVVRLDRVDRYKKPVLS